MPRLPENPTDYELEDFVAALLQAPGCFVEKSIQELNVLELDVVVTSYADGKPTPRLVEVKSKGWGFEDAFKVLGWMTYLGFQRGAFIFREPKRDLDAVARTFSSTGLKTIHLEKLDSALATLKAAGFQVIKDELALAVWRFSSWVERELVERLRAAKRAEPPRLYPREALRYYGLVNDATFLTRSVIERVERLYAAFRSHPKLTLAASGELKDGIYDTQYDKQNEVFRSVLRGKYPELQACLFIEHRARLSILKAAVDYLALEEAGLIAEKKVGKWVVGLFDLLPGTFREGAEWLRGQANYRHYPCLWQTFLWTWGGFILEDRVEEEYSELASQTGVPESEVPTALEAFDRIFGGAGQWIGMLGNTRIRALKLVPTPFRGLGAFQRLRRHKFEDYSKFGYADSTGYILTVWHRAGYELLSQSKSATAAKAI